MPLGREIAGGNGFFGPLPERGLWIEGVDVRRAAIQVNMDDALGPRCKLGRLGKERVERGNAGLRREQTCLLEQRGQAQHSQARAHLVEHLAPSEQTRRQVFEQVHKAVELLNKHGFIGHQQYLGELFPTREALIGQRFALCALDEPQRESRFG